MSAHVTLELAPSPLMQAFYVPTVIVDCGKPRDVEAIGCRAYLLWASEYPAYTPRLVIPSRPKIAASLNRALFNAHSLRRGRP